MLPLSFLVICIFTVTHHRLPHLFCRLLLWPALLVTSIGAVEAQPDDLPQAWLDMVELWNESADSPVSYEEVEELFELFSTQPINLNDTVGEGLGQLFFISPFQCAALHAYIEQFGALLSLEELELVPGFDAATVALLRPVVQAGLPAPSTGFRWDDFQYKGHHHLVVGGNGIVERSRGYRDSVYEGDPYRLYWRYRYRAGSHVQLQLSGDKDAGEALFSSSQQQGFDHYGFHLLLNDMGRLRLLIVGDYHLHFGQGTSLWTGFAPYSVLGATNYRSARGITAAGAFAEYGYMKGVAATVALWKPVELTLFCAHTPLDATVTKALADSTIDGLSVVQSIYLSGYHRTETELKKRSQMAEDLYGANLTYKGRNLRLGLTGYRMSLSKYIQPGNYRYNYYYFSGSENANVGLDAAYRYRNAVVYGEVSLSQNQHKAAIAGVDFRYGSNNSLGLSLHHYDAWYWNLHANGLAVGSHTRNEDALMLTTTHTLPLRFRLESSLAWARFPEMRSTAYGPSHAFDMRMRLSRPLGHLFSVAMRYRYKRQDANVKENGDYTLYPSHRHQYQVDLRCDFTDWHYALRAAWVDYRLDTEHSNGFLVHGDVRWLPETLPISVSARLSAFNVSDYDARIYAVENGLALDNNGTFFNHRGIRCYAVIHYDCNRWLAFAFKYSLTRYLDDSLFGTGYDALETNHRQQWHLQMRLKL